MVPRAPVTPAPAVTSDSAVTVSAGQLAAHCPLHALVVAPAASFVKMYRDIPFAPVTYFPSVASVPTASVIPAVAWEAGAVIAAGGVVAVVVATGAVVGLPPPAHA